MTAKPATERRINPQHYDLAIAGAGLTGAACALALARTGAGAKLKIALLEARTDSQHFAADEFDPRVVALTEASRSWLQTLGVWQEVARHRMCPYRRMVVRDGEGTAAIEFDCREVQQEDLGHIVEHSALLNALLKALAEMPNVELLCPARISEISRGESDGDIELALENQRIGTRLLVGADGSGSKVRAEFGFRERTWDYGHSAIVGTLRTEHEHEFIARQWFTASGPLAFLPLQTQGGDQHFTSIVWSQQHSEAQRLMALSNEQFCAALHRASEGALGDLALVNAGAAPSRLSFPLQQRHAVDYVQPNVVLIGDAAHTLHPLAGLGVNLGFADVRVLVDELACSLGKGLPVDDPGTLSRYQRRRKPENLAAMAAMEGFKRLFEASSPWARVLRNVGMSRLNELTAVKRDIIRQAMGLGRSGA